MVLKQEWMSEEMYAWACREEEARLASLERRNLGGKKAIVAIKAQHPLTPTGEPGLEYEQRLLKALEVQKALEAQGLKVTFLTFGGVHGGNAETTLAAAGAHWLIEHGIERDIIKPCPVVFSGNDEDSVAAQEFASDVEYSQLHVVMSVGQLDRARFFFLAAGWQPTFHTITFLDEKPYHSSTCEMWGPWAMPAFAKGVDAIRDATEAIRKHHMDEIGLTKVPDFSLDSNLVK